jgi:hypothetical protein
MNELERWEARFSAADFVFGTEPNAFLRSHAHLLSRQGKALAVADGCLRRRGISGGRR